MKLELWLQHSPAGQDQVLQLWHWLSPPVTPTRVWPKQPCIYPDARHLEPHSFNRASGTKAHSNSSSGPHCNTAETAEVSVMVTFPCYFTGKKEQKHGDRKLELLSRFHIFCVLFFFLKAIKQWDFEIGKHLLKLTNASGEVPINCLTFDSSGTRLQLMYLLHFCRRTAEACSKELSLSVW